MAWHSAVKATDGPVSRYLNRRLSWPITMFIVRYGIPITPNMMSFISFLVAAAAAALLAMGNGVLGGILVQVSSILDGVDGELARVTGRVSRKGGFLDAILDRYADIAVVAGLALYAYNLTGSAELSAVLAFTAVTGDLMVSYLHARGEASLGTHPSIIGRLPQYASRDVRLFIVFVGALIGKPLETLAAVTLISHTYVVARTIEVLAIYKEEEVKQKHKNP